MVTTFLDTYSEIVAKKHPVKTQQPQMLEFYCSNCKSKLAAIFQVDGDFCTECWQVIAHPNVECRS
ncbi:MAG TPA: hypothetical protein VJ742_06510 [Nitrososphaera sp.]|nr:hypothetical protein [Nitrososphaera sp.]